MLAQLHSCASCTEGFCCRLGLRTLRTRAGESTRVCVHTHVLVLACAPEHVCTQGHVCAPAACPRSLTDVSVCVHARAGAGGVCWATRTHMSGVALTCSRAHFTSPAASARRAPAPRRCRGMTHGLAEEAVTQSWIPASPHPPAGRPSRPRGACGTRAAAGTARRGRVPGAGAPRRTAGSGAGGDVPLRGNAGSLRGRGGPSGAREEAAPGARGGDAHALTPAQAGHWVQARARFPGVFRAVPAVRSPG